MTRTSSTAAPVLWEEVDSPLGSFLLAGGGRTVRAARLPGTWSKEEVPADWQYAPGSMTPAAEQLTAYFDGTRSRFELDLVPSGTPFQRSVWRALLDIEFATTASYRDVATAIGNERATRAVGLANNRNPIALLIPCHRVIGADGSLTGYGGGIEMKSWLLEHERKVTQRATSRA